jgi:hypothetical protein
VAGKSLGRRRLEHPLGERHEVRMVLAESRPGARRGRESPDAQIGMTEHEAEDLTTRVAAGARDRDRPHVA